MIQLQQRYRKTAVLTPQGLQKLEAAKLKAKPWKSGSKLCTLEALSEYTGLSSHTLSKIHIGKVGVDLRSLLRYFSAFDLTLESSDYIQLLRNETIAPVQTLMLNSVLLAKLSQIPIGVSWGMAPDVSQFYGRTAELITLKQWILEERCRLVTLLGIGGVGKTYLATKLAEQIQPEFKVVIWRSLRQVSQSHLPFPFSSFLHDLICHLTPHPIPTPLELLPELISTRIQQLLDLLRQYPCLLVLDHVESVLKSPTLPPAANDRLIERNNADFEAYSDLFKHLGQGRHQSCVILTSRAEPQPFWSLSGNTSGIRSLPIQGLPLADIQQMFGAKGTYQGTAAEWGFLVNYYDGNPLFLEIVARTIQRFFDYSITEFLRYNTLIFNDIRELLDQQLEEVSAPENAVMRILADQNVPLSFSDLRSQTSPSISTTALLEVLKSLKVRLMTNKTSAHFTLSPVLREYVKQYLR